MSERAREILFVTSFSPDLYRASGHTLLESFQTARQRGRILSCYEGTRPTDHRGKAYEYYNLDKDAFLHDWLTANKDVIPKHLGGTTEMCSCRDAHERHSRFHVKGCYWSWSNRNASRWFRKVASLRQAAVRAAELGTPWLVWLDSDTYFVKELPVSYLQEKLRGVALFYFQGHRDATESGILGFHLEQGGRAFIDALCQRYTSRDYLKYTHWDDGYQIGKLIDEGVAPALDLVHPTKWHRKTNDVIPTTDIKEYLCHKKGLHGRYMGIML